MINGVYIAEIIVTKYKVECREYLRERKLRGSLNQSKVTVHELANNTSVPTWTEARKLIHNYNMESYDEQSKDETLEGNETQAEKEASTTTETGDQTEGETSGKG